MEKLLNSYSVRQLQNIIKRSKIKISSNNKENLIESIDNDLNQLNINDLREILEKNFVDFSGNKQILIEKINKLKKPSLKEKIKSKLPNIKMTQNAKNFIKILTILTIGIYLVKFSQIKYLQNASLSLTYISTQIKDFTLLIFKILEGIKNNTFDLFSSNLEIILSKLDYTKTEIKNLISNIWNSSLNIKTKIFQVIILILEGILKKIDITQPENHEEIKNEIITTKKFLIDQEPELKNIISSTKIIFKKRK